MTVPARVTSPRAWRSPPTGRRCPSSVLRSGLAGLVRAERVERRDTPPLLATVYHLVDRGRTAEYLAWLDRAAARARPVRLRASVARLRIRPGAGRVSRRARTPRTRRETRRRRPGAGLSAADLAALRSAVAQPEGDTAPGRWNADPAEVQRSVARLVLTLAEFLRQLLERQAIRRMESGTLDPEQTEAVGLALMRLEETLGELAQRFDLAPEELNLRLGPLGRLI